MKITQYNFAEEQYIREEHPKKQIYLHHTAGNSDPFGVFRYWATNPERVATCVVIGGAPRSNSVWIDGEIAQGFSSKYWAYHLGLKESTFHSFDLPYISLDRISIGIEICNWGQLTYEDGLFYNYVNGIVSERDVCELSEPFKGFKYFHSYTDAQIETVGELLLYWNDRYGIPIDFNPDIFDITERALLGDPGVYTHNSVRRGKVDIYPHPKMVDMLQTL